MNDDAAESQLETIKGIYKGPTWDTRDGYIVSTVSDGLEVRVIPVVTHPFSRQGWVACLWSCKFECAMFSSEQVYAHRRPKAAMAELMMKWCAVSGHGDTLGELLPLMKAEVP